jgi:hypothetical protein
MLQIPQAVADWPYEEGGFFSRAPKVDWETPIMISFCAQKYSWKGANPPSEITCKPAILLFIKTLPLYLLFIYRPFFCSLFLGGPLEKKIPSRFGEPIRP